MITATITAARVDRLTATTATTMATTPADIRLAEACNVYSKHHNRKTLVGVNENVFYTAVMLSLDKKS